MSNTEDVVLSHNTSWEKSNMNIYYTNTEIAPTEIT